MADYYGGGGSYGGGGGGYGGPGGYDRGFDRGGPRGGPRGGDPYPSADPYASGGFGGGFGSRYGGPQPVPPVDPYAMGMGNMGMETAQSPLDAEIQVVVREIHNELSLFDQSGDYGTQFRNAKRLLAAEADKLENSIDPEWLEVDIPRPIKVTKKVLIPNFRHPHFNFVGKILGPKGASLQALAKQFKCHIYVLGRGSTKDRNKEKELLESGDPQYTHYGGPLHVKIETIAPAHVAYARVAGVLESLSNTLIPVRGDGPEAVDAAKKDEENGSNGGGSRGGRGGFRGGRGGPMRGGGRGRGGPGFRPY